MIFLTPVITWLGTWVGRAAVGGGILATFFGWLLLHDHRIRVEERNVTLANVSEGAKELDEKGIAARNAVREPGAADRLRKSWCSDCR
jgi:hypothetical protein